MLKKILISVIVIAIVSLAVGVGVYIFNKFSKKTVNTQPAVKPLSLLVPQKVISPVLSFDANKIWFMVGSGKLFRKPIDGQGSNLEEYLLPDALHSPKSIIWPQQGSDFIAEESVNGQTQYRFFSSDQKKFIQYPTQIQTPQFLYSSKNIVYKWIAPSGQNQLVTADSNAANYKKVTDLFSTDYQFAVSPTNPTVVLFSPFISTAIKLFLVDLTVGQFKEIGEKAVYKNVKFSPDGTKILVWKSIDSEDAGHLLVYDVSGQKWRDFGEFPATIETAWSLDSKSIILGKTDGFSRFDLSGQPSLLYKFAADENLNPENIMLHPSKSLLFFTDKPSGYLYMLKF